MRTIFVVGIFLYSLGVYAGSVGQLKTVHCVGENSIYLDIDRETKFIQGHLPGMPLLSSKFDTEPTEVELINWVPGRTVGFGGIVTDETQSRIAILSLILRFDQIDILPETGQFLVHAADTLGSVSQEMMECTLGF